MGWTKEEKDGYILVKQENGAELGYSSQSGARLIEQDGFLFKDLAGGGQLLPYLDWRLSYEERAADLASRLSIEQIAGLMLYSNHQAIPATSYDVSLYNGKPYSAGEANPWDITDNQRRFITEDNLRHILVTIVESPVVAAKWNNRVQALVEGLGFGIPANNSSDPRHSARADAEFNSGGGGAISMWPGSLGFAATFSPELVRRFAHIASKEYRLMGFTTALSPQVDLCTEPRWYRCHGTFGQDPYLAAAMAEAYCSGFQSGDAPLSAGAGASANAGTSANAGASEAAGASNWGRYSVNAMVKHWPGGGPCESGRDAHYGSGKYAVYPGNCFNLHKIPFTHGAFKLSSATKKASAVMPYYTIAYNQTSQNVANAFNREIIQEQLREQEGYDGVVCTDWLVTADEVHPGVHSGKPWGVEGLSVAERHYRALMAGCDQFGGNNDIKPVLEAFEIGVAEHGREWMEKRMRLSAKRLLLNIFRAGLFENPYIDVAETASYVGSPQLMQEGYQAQLRSVVMLKNHNGCLPIRNSATVKAYIPDRELPDYLGFWGTTVKAKRWAPVRRAVAERYFTIVESPEDADVALFFMESPMGGKGYSLNDGNPEYLPISLQYGDYTATAAREVSIAGGDPFEDFTNRSYRGKSVKTVNKCEMERLVELRRRMGEKPIILSVNVSNPFVISELEPLADAIFLTFDIQNQAILDIVTGKDEPSAKLPFQMPASMDAIERHCEDKPLDIECYRDSDGNTYNFGFGLNWRGTL